MESLAGRKPSRHPENHFEAYIYRHYDNKRRAWYTKRTFVARRALLCLYIIFVSHLLILRLVARDLATQSPPPSVSDVWGQLLQIARVSGGSELSMTTEPIHGSYVVPLAVCII